MPLFSVVIPTYGRPRYLIEAVASVLSQSVSDLECIVVDDASPSPVPKLSGDARVTVVRRPSNGGAAAARNSGLAFARGRYVTFLDDDDIYVPTRLQLALEGLERARVALCWARYMNAAQPGRTGRVLDGLVPGQVLGGTTPHLDATAIHRAFAGRFDSTYRAAEDVEWWVRTAQRCDVATVPEVGALIRRHTGRREGYGIVERRDATLRLLDHHRAFFRAYPAGAAFRWKRVGLMSSQIGDRRAARRAFVRSLRLHPTVRTAVHLARTMAPGHRRAPGG